MDSCEAHVTSQARPQTTPIGNGGRGGERLHHVRLITPILRKYQAVCYHSQQCVEKALKALVLEKAAAVPKSHDIVDLRTRVAELGWSDSHDKLRMSAPIPRQTTVGGRR